MIRDEIYISTNRYVYYDENGEIISIGNSNNVDGNYIVLSLDKVINFLTGKENTSSYAVIYDTLLKEYVLKLKYYSDETSFSITDDIYKIENIVDQKPDLTITQDIKNKKWQFAIDQGLQSYLQSQSSAYNKKLHFSITRKNDPHELYRLIIIDFSTLIKNSLLEIPFRYQSEESPDNLSVYTTKRFETYVYEVKNVE
jgi:hypothetical protein